MDPVVEYLLTNFGVPGIISAGFYLIIIHSTRQRKEERDAQMDTFRHRIESVESKQAAIEKNIADEVRRLYDQLIPIGYSVKKIEGYMEAKNDKS